MNVVKFCAVFSSCGVGREKLLRERCGFGVGSGVFADEVCAFLFSGFVIIKIAIFFDRGFLIRYNAFR